jgi:hypothetical protein
MSGILFTDSLFSLDRSCDTLLANPATALVVPAIGIIVFALWGFLPLMRDIRNRFDHGGNWKKSPTYLISTSYLQPLLLWTGATLICRYSSHSGVYNLGSVNPILLILHHLSAIFCLFLLLFVFVLQHCTGLWIQLCCLQQQAKQLKHAL